MLHRWVNEADGEKGERNAGASGPCGSERVFGVGGVFACSRVDQRRQLGVFRAEGAVKIGVLVPQRLGNVQGSL